MPSRLAVTGAFSSRCGLSPARAIASPRPTPRTLPSGAAIHTPAWLATSAGIANGASRDSVALMKFSRQRKAEPN